MAKENSVNCYFCGEVVLKSARVCKHCHRSLLYSIFVSPHGEEKDLYLIFKAFSDKSRDDERFFPLGSLKDFQRKVKRDGAELATNILASEKEEFEKDYPALSFRLQEGLDQALIEDSERVSLSSSNRAIFLGLATSLVFVLAVGFFFHFENSEPAQQFEILNSYHETETEIPLTFPTAHPSPPPAITRPTEGSLTRESILHLLNATVFIYGNGSLGSGFFISPDGYILSNKHVLERMTEPVVHLRSGERLNVENIELHETLDLALLKVRTDRAPYLRMGDANELHPGQRVLTIGNPSGLSWTVTQGIVSYVGRSIQGVPYIQTDAAINPGNSGGPMINENNEVVAINTLTSKNEQGISFALPINFAYQSDGIAFGLGEPPLGRPSFTAQNLETQTSFQSVDPYQQESEQRRDEYMKEFNEIKDRASKIQKRVEILQEEIQNPNLPAFQRKRRQEELQKLMIEYNETLKTQHLWAQKRYFSQLISILERQKTDPRYSPFASQIDEQIISLRAKLKEVEKSL